MKLFPFEKLFQSRKSIWIISAAGVLLVGLIVLFFYLYNQLQDDSGLARTAEKQGLSYKEIRKLLNQYTGQSGSYKGSGSGLSSSKTNQNQAVRVLGGLFVLLVLMGIVIAIIVFVGKKKR